MIDELEWLLKSVVVEVFHRMLNIDIRPVSFEKEAMSSEAHIAGSVGFIGTKTGVEDQIKAQQIGFNSTVTKPTDIDDLKSKISRALNLDTSYKYFQQRDGVLPLDLPVNFGQAVANEVTLHLRPQLSEAVDTGLDEVIMDFSHAKTVDIAPIKPGLEFMGLCAELLLKNRIIGSDAVTPECKYYEETKDWRFMNSFEEAMAALN